VLQQKISSEQEVFPGVIDDSLAGRGRSVARSHFLQPTILMTITRIKIGRGERI
jgi:hypothetical protein